MQFCKVSICKVLIFRLYTDYNKHEMIKNWQQKREKNRKYYRKCSNNFAVNFKHKLKWF